MHQECKATEYRRAFLRSSEDGEDLDPIALVGAAVLRPIAWQIKLAVSEQEAGLRSEVRQSPRQLFDLLLNSRQREPPARPVFQRQRQVSVGIIVV